MKLDSQIEIADDVICRDLGGELVLLHLESGYYFGLNAVGMRMWRLLEAGDCRLGDVVDVLTHEFDVARDIAEADVLAVANDLLAHDLIRIVAV